MYVKGSHTLLFVFFLLTLAPQRGKTTQPFKDNNKAEHASQLSVEIEVSVVYVVALSACVSTLELL